VIISTNVQETLAAKLPANEWAKAIAQGVDGKDGKGGGKPMVALGSAPYKTPADVEKAIKAGKDFAAGKV